MNHVDVVAVGGTIDKVYFDALSVYEVGDPAATRTLGGFPLNFTWQVTSLLRKDSLEMTDEDRQRVVDFVRQNCGRHVLITHGTDTMVQTARALTAITDKCIVLTGAMKPAGFDTSDATFNLGCAVGALNVMSPGVFVTMSGRVLPPDRIEKDRAAGVFREVSDPR